MVKLALLHNGWVKLFIFCTCRARGGLITLFFICFDRRRYEDAMTALGFAMTALIGHIHALANFQLSIFN
jgi:prepilin signal peptidase PulO-like enzyme (type II secretory pathway)